MQSKAVKPTKLENEPRTQKEKACIASSCALQAAEWLRAYSRILTQLHPVTPAR